MQNTFLIFYTTIGYDCPLGTYPSPAVPIICNLFNGQYKAVYLDDNLKIHTDPVLRKAKFSKLSITIKKKLKEFDYRKHRLYAISESNVDFYETHKEKEFFIQLLEDKNFSKDNPFVRVSLAEETGEQYIFRRELQNYEQYLEKHDPNLLPFWNEEVEILLKNFKKSEIDKIRDRAKQISIRSRKQREDLVSLIFTIIFTWLLCVYIFHFIILLNFTSFQMSHVAHLVEVTEEFLRRYGAVFSYLCGVVGVWGLYFWGSQRQ
jgi:hypothetical protein